MKVIYPLMTAIIFSACSSGSADKKVPELANEMCDCFSSFQKDLSSDAIELMKKVAQSENPQQEMAAGISKLKPEDAASFGKKLSSIADKGSDVYNCMQAFDNKHSKETTGNKKDFTEKMLKIMQENNSCPVGAAIVNLGFSKDKIK